MSDATQGRFTPRCSPYQDRPLVRVQRPDEETEGAARAATREAVASEQGRKPPVVRTGEHRCGNLREDHPEAYEQWRLRLCFLQRRFYDRDPRLPGGRALAGRTADEKLKHYVALAAAGQWPTKTAVIAGLPVQVPLDPFTECWKGVNSRDRWLSRARRAEERDGGGDAGRGGAERPLCEALAELGRSDAGWHPAECDRDPAEAWARRLSRRQARVAQVGMALRMGRRRLRLRWLDRLLDTISALDDDPAFASLLLEWVCDQEPGYQLHCEAKLARIHQRGRKARAWEWEAATEESKQAA